MQLTGSRQIIVGAIYRPPSGPVVPTIDDMHDQFAHVISKMKPVYIIGDTNFDITRSDKVGVKEYLRLLSDLSLHQMIKSPTHPGPNPSLIDHLITNRLDLTSDSDVVTVGVEAFIPLCNATLRGLPDQNYGRRPSATR